MSMSLDAAATAMREAMRETVKRHSLWYLIQGALMVIAGALALIYPLVSSVAVFLFLGWLLIISGIVQGISLFDARFAAFLASAHFSGVVHYCWHPVSSGLAKPCSS